jgi:apolipoprotein N-acyltransferase
MYNRFTQFLGIFGLIGILGLLSLPNSSTDYYIYLNFFMLFFLFIRKGDRTDERWERNTNRAAKNAFLSIVVTLCFFADIVWFTKSFEVLPPLSAIMLPLAVSVFVVSYVYYDRRGE